MLADPCELCGESVVEAHRRFEPKLAGSECCVRGRVAHVSPLASKVLDRDAAPSERLELLKSRSHTDVRTATDVVHTSHYPCCHCGAPTCAYDILDVGEITRLCSVAED